MWLNAAQWSLVVLLLAVAPFFNPQLFIVLNDCVWYVMSLLDESGNSFDRLLIFDAPHMQPLSSEGVHYNIKIVKGLLPPELDGVTVSIGPNQKYPNRFGYFGNQDDKNTFGRLHWFEGDGMIYVLNIFPSNQSIHFTNAWIKTPKIQQESEYNHSIHRAMMGESLHNGWIGIFKSLWGMFVRSRVSPFHIPSDAEIGMSNTAPLFWNNQMFALAENCLPFEISINATDSTVMQLGWNPINPAWSEWPFTAHPVLDPLTRELIAFGDCFGSVSVAGEDHVNIGILQENCSHNVMPSDEDLDAWTQRVKSRPRASRYNYDYNLLQPASRNQNEIKLAQVQTRHPQMMHDVVVTRKYVIVQDSDLWIGSDVVDEYQSLAAWMDTKLTRFGFVPREIINLTLDELEELEELVSSESGELEQNQIKWVEAKGGFTYHMAAAWDDILDGKEVVKMLGCRLENADLRIFQEPGELGSTRQELEQHRSYLYEWIIDLEGQQVVKEGKVKMGGMSVDFPVTHPMRKAGVKPDTVFFSLFKPMHAPYSDLVNKISGIVKYKVDDGSYEVIDFGEERVGLVEHMFFPSDASGERDGEGYVGMFVYDYQTSQTTFQVFDATKMTQEPVVVVQIPHRIPAGFHSMFVQRADFEKRQRK